MLNKNKSWWKFVVITTFLFLLGSLLLPQDSLSARRKTRVRQRAPVVQDLPDRSKEPFWWGAMVRPLATSVETKKLQEWKVAIDDQIKFAKEIGLNSLRANWEDNDDVVDYLVDKAVENNLQLTIVLEDKTLTDFFNQANFQRGYEFALKIAVRYKGRVPFYQLGNEASGAVIKPGAHGSSINDYDAAKYGVYLQWLKGLSQGVHDGDPAARKIVSANWKGIGIFEKLAIDGLHFDIVGWNWYSEMGDIFNRNFEEMKKTINIPQYMWEKYHKDVWLTEANKQEGTFDGNFKKQEDFIRGFGPAAYGSSYIKGFFFHELVDQASKQGIHQGHWGLVKVKEQGDGWAFSDKKPGYYAYRDVVQPRVLKYASKFLSQSPPPAIPRGGAAQLRATFKNTAIGTWTRGLVHLEVVNDSGGIGGALPFLREGPDAVTASGWATATKIQLQEPSVAPGHTGSFEFWLKAPANMAPGTYRINFRPSADNVRQLQNTNIWWDVWVY